MRTDIFGSKFAIVVVLLLFSFCLEGISDRALYGQDGTKGIDPSGAYEVDSAEVKERRKPVSTPPSGSKNKRRNSKANKAPATKTDNKPTTPQKSTYVAESGFPQGKLSENREYVQLGVTIWRISGERIGDTRSVLDEAERTSDKSLMMVGDRIQMSIEPLSGEGYLYVINREQNADGRLAQARLIFPTLSIYGGNNRIRNNVPITLPAPDRSFRITRGHSEKPQQAEAFTIILTRKPLDDLPETIGRDAMRLPDELIAKWEQKWGGKMFAARLQSGVGTARTLREKPSTGTKGVEDEASIQALSQTDPLPQTYFKGAITKGTNALFTVFLRIGENSSGGVQPR